ncbi:MAG: protein phosphatase 2C domain-containing protein [Prevotella sp.]|nr:protein phosphatase 2C domain-containing protein [Prevotella sp.]
MSEVKIKLAAGTNVGLVRQNNEDNFVVSSDLSTSEWLIPQAGPYTDLGEFGALLVVADGMGGANAGEVASAITVESIQEKFVPELLKDVVNDDKTVQEFMKNVVKETDLAILNRSKEDSSTSGMGTTIVMAWLLNDKAYVCWCGDSRCYVLNKQHGLIQLSKDHSYVQELVDKGELDPEMMHDHPLSNIITRCLGDVENRANPETRIYQLQHGDCIMLCSDGLCGLCRDDEICDIMQKFHTDPMACKNELISAALSCGGYDNVTIALADIQTEKGAAEDEEKEQNAETQEEEKTEETEEDLKSTIRSETIGRRSHKFRNFFLVLLALCIAAGAFIWFYKGCEPVKQAILSYCNSWLG